MLLFRSTPCLYCNERFRTEPQHLMHRQSRHTMLDFGCGKCNFQSPFADQLASHLVLAHQITDAKREDMVALSNRGLARLPADLRSLRCRLCLTHGRRRFLLGQDRVALRSHVERGHDGLRIGLKALKYECRICGEEFPQTEEFLRHPCCEANGQSRILPHPLMPEGEEQEQYPAAKRPRTDDDCAASTSSKKEEGDADDAEQCLYCERKVDKNSKASHRAAHWQLEFICDVDCSR